MQEFTKKRLLLQGAGRGNLGLIKTAKAHGVYVVLTGWSGDYPCNPFADKLCNVDITDCDAVLSVAQDEHVDGAIICGNDLGIKAIGRINDKLCLTGISETSAEASSNKLLMKEKLVAAGVKTARFYKIHEKKELFSAVKELGYPVIIKAVDLQGSKGISIVREESALQSAFADTMSLTQMNYCILEEFIVGTEYGAQAFVFQNKVLFVLPHGDETIMCKTAVPVGHYIPYRMPDSLYKDTCRQVETAIFALGFNNCAVNVDLIEKDGQVFVIELTGRVGANCLPELTSFYLGINYYEMILSTCLGGSPIPYWEKRQAPCATLARMVRSDRNGIVKSISVPNVVDAHINMFIHAGSEVYSFSSCHDAIGEVVVKGTTLEECEDKMSNIMTRIIVIYE